MIKLTSLLSEAKQYQVYHKTFSSAVQLARATAEKEGYTIDEHDWSTQIAFGSGKPSAGKTFKAHIGLEKNGKPAKKILAIQVYGMPTQYELNFYIA